MSTLELDDCFYLGVCLEGFFFGAISVLQLPCPFLRKSNIPTPSFPGLYSGIFALYIQCHASRTDAVKANNILFYLLCCLYFLSIATISVEMVYFVNTSSGFLLEVYGDLAEVSIVHLFLIKKFLVALITGWAGLHHHCSIHLIRLLRLHRPVHPSTRIF